MRISSFVSTICAIIFLFFGANLLSAQKLAIKTADSGVKLLSLSREGFPTGLSFGWFVLARDFGALPAPFDQYSAPSATSAFSQAEYAIRWNAGEGGPKNALEALSVLGQTKIDSDTFEVLYFDFSMPGDAPPGVTGILRQRKKKTKYELTFKYRSDGEIGYLGCPLSSSPKSGKVETDVTFLGADESKRRYSSSCTVESLDPPIPPAALGAKPKGCISAMTRLVTGTLSVEEWHLPGGEIMIDVSSVGTDGAEEFAAFRQNVVEKFIASGVKPLKTSKTELGSSCP